MVHPGGVLLVISQRGGGWHYPLSRSSRRRQREPKANVPSYVGQRPSMPLPPFLIHIFNSCAVFQHPHPAVHHYSPASVVASTSLHDDKPGHTVCCTASAIWAGRLLYSYSVSLVSVSVLFVGHNEGQTTTTAIYLFLFPYHSKEFK